MQNGEVVGLLGPNGAGKTTTFYMICGLISSTSGAIFLDFKDISNVPLHKRAKLGIGYLPQESSIFKDLSVEENLMLAAEIARRGQDILPIFDVDFGIEDSEECFHKYHIHLIVS